MVQQLRGKDVAKTLESSIMQNVTMWNCQGIRPKMVTILVDGDDSSYVYAIQKGKMASRLGIEFELKRLPNHISEKELGQLITGLNRDPLVHGIMLELPLPSHIHSDRVIAAISPMKDVDGLTSANREANMCGSDGIYPATPQACVGLLEHYGYSVSGKRVALVGCGKTVGMPLFHLLLRKNATVTVCHAGTTDLAHHISQAEILFVAVGKTNLITPKMVNPDLVVIDAGINQTMNGEIVGDVSKEAASLVAAISPTPGGVGVVTTRQLFANMMTAMNLQLGSRQPVTV